MCAIFSCFHTTGCARRGATLLRQMDMGSLTCAHIWKSTNKQVCTRVDSSEGQKNSSSPSTARTEGIEPRVCIPTLYITTEPRPPPPPSPSTPVIIIIIIKYQPKNRPAHEVPTNTNQRHVLSAVPPGQSGKTPASSKNCGLWQKRLRGWRWGGVGRRGRERGGRGGVAGGVKETEN